MASLIEDLAKEMKHVKTDSSNIKRDSASKMDPLVDKCNEAQKAVGSLQQELSNIKNQVAPS